MKTLQIIYPSTLTLLITNISAFKPRVSSRHDDITLFLSCIVSSKSQTLTSSCSTFWPRSLDLEFNNNDYLWYT